MSTNSKIKVIKKGEVRNTAVPVLVEKKSKQESARQMVSKRNQLGQRFSSS